MLTSKTRQIVTAMSHFFIKKTIEQTKVMVANGNTKRITSIPRKSNTMSLSYRTSLKSPNLPGGLGTNTKQKNKSEKTGSNANFRTKYLRCCFRYARYSDNLLRTVCVFSGMFTIKSYHNQSLSGNPMPMLTQFRLSCAPQGNLEKEGQPLFICTNIPLIKPLFVLRSPHAHAKTGTGTRWSCVASPCVSLLFAHQGNCD